MFTPVYKSCLVVLVLLTCSCAAFELRDANRQLTSYYSVLYEARTNVAKTSDNAAMVETATAGLGVLASDSAAAASSASNALNQIAFYRIATTAAWQARKPEIISYAASGTEICNQGDNYSKAPRDCGMLLAIPLFAAADDTTNRFNQLQSKMAQHPKDYKCDTEALFTDYRDSINSVLQKRPDIQASAAHPSLLQSIDKNSSNLLCEIMDINIRGLIGRSGGNIAAMDCDINQVKRNAFAAGLNHNLMSCLPESDSELPPACTGINKCAPQG